MYDLVFALLSPDIQQEATQWKTGLFGLTVQEVTAPYDGRVSLSEYRVYLHIQRENRKWDQAKKPQGTSPVTQFFFLGPTSRLAPDSEQVFIHMSLGETFHCQNTIEGTSQRFAGTGVGEAVG